MRRIKPLRLWLSWCTCLCPAHSRLAYGICCVVAESTITLKYASPSPQCCYSQGDQRPPESHILEDEPAHAVHIHSGSGYRKLTGEGEDDIKGYGIRGANILRRGGAPSGKPAVHMFGSLSKSRRLQVRSSYAAEALAAAHNLDEAYPTIITLRELMRGPLAHTQLRDAREGKLKDGL